VHAGLLIFLLYGLVGGLAVAVGDRLTIPWLDGASGLDFASYAGLRVTNMMLAGGLVYILALIFI
jgi:hypothetical protein